MRGQLALTPHLRADVMLVDEVLAVGDGRNDAEMLAWAGRGVAMGQAPPEVQQIADAVTDSFDDRGLVTELRRWF